MTNDRYDYREYSLIIFVIYYLSYHLAKRKITYISAQKQDFFSSNQLDLLYERSTIKKQIHWIYSPNSVNLFTNFTEIGFTELNFRGSIEI